MVEITIYKMHFILIFEGFFLNKYIFMLLNLKFINILTFFFENNEYSPTAKKATSTKKRDISKSFAEALRTRNINVDIEQFFLQFNFFLKKWFV